MKALKEMVEKKGTMKRWKKGGISLRKIKKNTISITQIMWS